MNLWSESFDWTHFSIEGSGLRSGPRGGQSRAQPQHVALAPALGPLQIDVDQQVQVRVQHGKARNLEAEDGDQFFQPLLDPTLAVLGGRLQQKRAAHRVGDAVVPGRQQRIDNLRTGHGHDSPS